jgi:hypothetical protein
MSLLSNESLDFQVILSNDKNVIFDITCLSEEWVRNNVVGILRLTHRNSIVSF